MRSVLGAALCAAWLICTPPAAQAAPAPPAETRAERDARMAWWREARFGMFIHWGVYSVPAGTYDGRRIGGIGEWIMNSGKIPCATYQAYAKEFNPVDYDPEGWAALAKAAGMKYLVITSKHHDGFALFGTQASKWNVVDATPYGKDLLKPLAEACERQGIRLGFYYSQAQDWNNGGSAAGGKWDPAQERSMDEYIDQVAVPQVKEILSNYGKLGVLWWDTPTDMNPERAAKLFELTKLQPGIITNNRLGGGFDGDTETPEQYIPPTGYPGGRDFEVCMTMNDTWGYKSYDENWKPVETLLRNLIDIASKGGNYLLNVGPTSRGLIPNPSVERLLSVGEWMKVNGEAIYGSSPSAFKRLPWGRCTTKSTDGGTTLYLHVFDWPAAGRLLVPGLKSAPLKAWLLADPAKALTAQKADEGVVIAVPATAPDAISSTVVLQIAGVPEVEPILLTQAADGSLSLPAVEATLHGEAIRYESGHGHDNIGFWTNPAEWVEFPVNVTRGGRFKVSADIAAMGAGRLDIVVGDQRLTCTAPVTGDYTKFQTVDLGELTLPAGKVAVQVRAIADGWSPINLKALKFVPQG